MRAARKRRVRPLLSLAEAWDNLSIAQRSDEILLKADLLSQILRDPDFDLPPLARARLIGDLGDPALAQLLVPLVLAPHDVLRESAAESLTMLTARATGLPASEINPVRWEAPLHAAPPAGFSELHQALTTLASLYPEHRQRAVLRCVLAALSPEVLAFPDRSLNPLAAWFHGRDPAAQMALRSELKRFPGVLGRLRAWQGLGRAPVAAAALDRLSQAAVLEEHESVLRCAHLAANPMRAERLAIFSISGRKPARFVPEPDRLSALSNGARLGYARVLPLCRIDTAELVRRLEPLLSDPEPRVRFAAMFALPSAAVSDYCFDAHPGIAAAATERAHPPESTWQSLVRSPHPHIRRIAHDEWGSAARQRLAWARDLAEDGGASLARLRNLLRDDEQQPFALELVRRRHLASACELELLSLAATLSLRASDAPVPGGSPAQRSLATIASLLAHCPSTGAAQALQGLLSHTDPRIRSNAAESISRSSKRLQTPLPAGIIELKSDPSHRVRGGILRSMLLEHPAHAGSIMAPLAEMVAHDHPLHRLAGLWVIERGSLGGAAAILEPIAPALARMASSDDEHLLRERARRCAARLLASLRGRWSQRAPALMQTPTCPAASGTP